jgi:hypothetical protein
MAELPPRRRFQFRLRTLMVVVTLLALPCTYVGGQAKIVRDRAAALAASGRMLYQAGELESPKDLPWMRRLLGDKHYSEIILEDDAPDEFVATLRLAFPEAIVVRFTEYRRIVERVPLR